MSTSEEENKVLYRRTFEEVFNQGNLALVDELVAPDYLNHEVPPGMNNRGPEATQQEQERSCEARRVVRNALMKPLFLPPVFRPARQERSTKSLAHEVETRME